MTDAETRRVYDKIDALGEKVSDLHGDVQKILGGCDPCRRQLDRVTVLVYSTISGLLVTVIGGGLLFLFSK